MAGITTKLTLNASDFVRGIDRSKKSALSLKTSMSSIGSGISSAFSGVAKSVGAIGIAATGAAAAVGGIAYKLISIGEEGLQAENRIKSVVKTMGLFGDQSDDVADRLIKMADATELATGVDGDLIMASQAKLATFKELAKTAGTTGGAFDRATQASLDMAAVFGGDASNYAVQLGKALEDPEKGLAALKRTGALTTSQIKAISQEFAQTGNRAKAFDQVLKAIETQVGGSANATASGMSRIKVSVGQMLEEIGKPMAEVFSKFAADVAKMTPQIIDSFSKLAPKIREVGYTITAALAEALQGDTSRMVKIGELIGESVMLGFKVALTRGFAEATESTLRLMEDYNPIRKMSKWSQDTFGNDPFFNEGKLSEEVSNAKGPIMENQIGDGIERIRSLFKEISVANTPQKQPPSDFFSRDRAAAETKRKSIHPTQPETGDGPSITSFDIKNFKEAKERIDSINGQSKEVSMEVLGTQDVQKAQQLLNTLQGKSVQAAMEVLGTQDVQKAQQSIDKLTAQANEISIKVIGTPDIEAANRVIKAAEGKNLDVAINTVGFNGLYDLKDAIASMPSSKEVDIVLKSTNLRTPKELLDAIKLKEKISNFKKSPSQNEDLESSRAQYRLEVDLVRARIAGDQKRIDALQREQAIREEITRLEALGMTDKGAQIQAAIEVLGTKDMEKAQKLVDALQSKNIQVVMDLIGTKEMQKAQALMDKLKGVGVKDTAAKMVDARAAADEADKAREKNKNKPPVDSGGAVAQLGSVAKATNVFMGRAANDGLLDENRRQTSLLRAIKENTMPKKSPPDVYIPVFGG